MSNARDLASPFLLDSNKDIIPSAFANGAILQLLINHGTTTETAFAYQNRYNFPSISITPKSTSSTLIFWSNPILFSRAADRASAAYGWTQLYVEETTTGNTSSQLVSNWLNYADTYNIPDGLRLQYNCINSYSNTGTTERTFRAFAYCNIANGQGRVGDHPRYTNIIAEVE